MKIQEEIKEGVVEILKQKSSGIVGYPKFKAAQILRYLDSKGIKVEIVERNKDGIIKDLHYEGLIEK